MKFHLKKFTFFIAVLFPALVSISAQTSNFPEPREEKLLNHLKVLIWNQPNSGRVTVKIRVHNGSAFDPADKAGTMVLLGDILFPEEGIRKFFEDELGGSLEVVNTYDYLQINATANAREFVTLLETVAPAVSNPQIDKELTAKIKARHLEKLKELEKNPEYVADRAIAERLLGEFPYGRPIHGTTESIEKIDFADLIFAEQRFFNADNATLAIIGDVDPDFAYKAARRLFGAWKKGDSKVPATFRLPDEPDETPLIVNVDEENISENRYAVNSTAARGSRDFYAAEILAEILNERFRRLSARDNLEEAFVKHKSNLLRGYLVFAQKYKNSPDAGASDDSGKSAETFAGLFKEKFSGAEFSRAKNKILADLAKSDAADFYLDLDTYKLGSPRKEFEKASKTTLADVEKVALALRKEKIADVSVSSVEKEIPANNPAQPAPPVKKDPNDPRK